MRRDFEAATNEIMPTVVWKFIMSAVALCITLAGVSLAAASFKILHVDDLAALMTTNGSTVWIYDVNPPSVRAKEGIVPGARLLSSSEGFDVATDLPPAKDAKLVFYCANTH